MTVTYVIEFDVIPDERSAFMVLLNGVLDAMRSESAFVEAILHADPANENRLMLYETWEDHNDVINTQLHRPYRQAFHKALPNMLIRERDISIWHALRADRAARG
jgi:(4S)-4-hydroxy-5-phosphonooxypentane-2,3-dione isomerase